MAELEEIKEVAEQIEATGHKDAGHTGNFHKYVGITMACLGVILAFAAAMVGGERTELIATMVKQTNAAIKYQAISTKHRILVAQLQQLDALNPTQENFKKWDEESIKLVREISSADVKRAARVNRLENAKNLDAEIPTRQHLEDFVKSVRYLDQEKGAASRWTKSYERAIEAHSKAAQYYEWGQLASEIGIVFAAIALLFHSPRVWHGTLVLGASAVLILGVTFVSESRRIHGAEHEIDWAEKGFECLNGEEKDKAADEELLEKVEKGGSFAVDPDRPSRNRGVQFLEARKE